MRPLHILEAGRGIDLINDRFAQPMLKVLFNFGRTDQGAVTKQDQALDEIFQFTYVTFPLQGGKQVKCLGAELTFPKPPAACQPG